MAEIYWELLDFEFKFGNFFIGIILDIMTIVLGIKVFQELQKRRVKFSLDTTHFYCILFSVF